MSVPDIYFKGVRKEIAALLPQHYLKILEIGCGEGDFYSNMKSDCEYWAVEPNYDAFTIASGKLDKVIMGTYQDVYDQLPNSYFDLVICNDVIEHMCDYEFFFQSIKSKLSNTAYIVGSIPNVRYISNLIEILVKKDWKYKDEGILDKTHLRFFTFKSLERLFKSHDFVIEKLFGINGVKKRFTPPKRLLQNILIAILGQDSRFMQFGFSTLLLKF